MTDYSIQRAEYRVDRRAIIVWLRVGKRERMVPVEISPDEAFTRALQLIEAARQQIAKESA